MSAKESRWPPSSSASGKGPNTESNMSLSFKLLLFISSETEDFSMSSKDLVIVERLRLSSEKVTHLLIEEPKPLSVSLSALLRLFKEDLDVDLGFVSSRSKGTVDKWKVDSSSSATTLKARLLARMS